MIMARTKASVQTHSTSKPTWTLDRNSRGLDPRNNSGITLTSCGLENTWNRLENRSGGRNSSKKDKPSDKDQGQGADKKKCLAG
jgi:hypothetical protein